MGKQFRDLPNIVWVMGGDFTPKQEDQWVVAEMAEGIRRRVHAPDDRSRIARELRCRRLWRAEVAHGQLASTATRKRCSGRFRTEYQRRPIRPFVLIESTYEGEHNSTPDQIRRQAYWAMLGGACGQFFGNNPMWHFDGPGLYPVETTWKEALDGTGSRDMTRLRDFFTGLPWHRLEPEKNHEIVTDGYGEGVATALTARTADKRLSVTYIPSTGTESRKLTVDLKQFPGPITARWYNPADGRMEEHPRRSTSQSRLAPVRHAGRQRHEDERLASGAGSTGMIYDTLGRRSAMQRRSSQSTSRSTSVRNATGKIT